jgi:hypothetical protein
VSIVDLSGTNSNVYYELGLAHAMDKNVIMIVRKEGAEPPPLPFDLANYRVIPYEDNIKGGRLLKEELVKTLNSLEAWGDRPTNPVHDFLPHGERPVDAGEHRAIREQSRRLEKENARLKGMEQIMEPLFDALGGGKPVSFGENLNRFKALLSEGGDVTVSVPDSGESGNKVIPIRNKKRKIRFKKVT